MAGQRPRPGPRLPGIHFSSLEKDLSVKKKFFLKQIKNVKRLKLDPKAKAISKAFHR